MVMSRNRKQALIYTHPLTSQNQSKPQNEIHMLTQHIPQMQLSKSCSLSITYNTLDLWIKFIIKSYANEIHQFTQVQHDSALHILFYFYNLLGVVPDWQEGVTGFRRQGDPWEPVLPCSNQWLCLCVHNTRSCDSLVLWPVQL